MSHQEQGAVTFAITKPVLENILGDVSQAHLALGAVIAMLHADGAVDPISLAHLLEYIEVALQGTGTKIEAQIHDGAPQGVSGNA